MTTTTTSEKKRIKITLSDARPVSVDPDNWPIIAEAYWFNGEHECQANRVARIKVRQHADGRAIVYAFERGGPGGVPSHNFRDTYAGYMLAKGDDIPRAIRRVAGAIGYDGLGSECIGDLPEEEV